MIPALPCLQFKTMSHPLQCLLIDNDEDDQEIFAMALKEISPVISCTFMSSGIMALEKLKTDLSFLPSLIFIDLNMPLMDGEECLLEIKKLSHLEKVPIYIYSTAALPRLAVRMKELGAADFIVKPSSFKKLIELLSGIFQQHKSIFL